MTTKRDAEISRTLTLEEAKRKGVVTQMLAEREQRKAVSREELKRMREQGRY